MARVEKAGLRVDETLATFINEQALPGSGVDPRRFWEGLSTLLHEFGPRNRALLEKRDELQATIDAWHMEHRAAPDRAAYRDFLAVAAIYYLVVCWLFVWLFSLSLSLSLPLPASSTSTRRQPSQT